MIYEDVQKEEVPQGPNNGWSSSEFESYDEQSDSEKAASRSKAAMENTLPRQKSPRNQLLITALTSISPEQH
ncbi:rho guanine nucleotide exchange factor 10-like protein isoform X1 [Tachysurus ichikawai]